MTILIEYTPAPSSQAVRRMPRRLTPFAAAGTAVAALLAIAVSPLTPSALAAEGASAAECAPSPVHSPWGPGTAPGAPADVPFLSAHRGGTNLAPQQTAEAYRSALAFGATVIEIDIRRLSDGTLVAYHDGEGPGGQSVSSVDLAEFKSWNAATGEWAGTAYDPARYLTFAEALDIAGQAGAGLDIEFKEVYLLDRKPYRQVAQAVADAGLMDRTLWQYSSNLDPLILAVQGIDPSALFNYNLSGAEQPSALYDRAAGKDFSFGSDLAKFTAPRLAAIHDGCGIAVPHSYDAGPDQEFTQIQQGRANGVDGFQTNQVDVAADALDRPVPSAWQAGPTPDTACLVNPANGYGLLGRTVTRADGSTAVTGPGGCATTGGQAVSFAGDGAALPAAHPAVG
ncbi:glycerophosphodiester phosphodiesterase [Streptomyces pathocidini]|uniref:Glycerophosphodiester phosphodiesterase n=1 Tax=Streptomyces pathocidini TaxID=1650571 RepID=A0ABW7UX64_9ACTN|nr:glycerophosphodiester phosphodiesterase family protein [Streptomyces pathocidini]